MYNGSITLDRINKIISTTNYLVKKLFTDILKFSGHLKPTVGILLNT